MAWFEGPRFHASANSAESVHSEEAWLACALCFALVRADDREAIVERRVAGVRRRPKRNRAPHRTGSKADRAGPPG